MILFYHLKEKKSTESLKNDSTSIRNSCEFSVFLPSGIDIFAIICYNASRTLPIGNETADFFGGIMDDGDGDTCHSTVIIEYIWA